MATNDGSRVDQTGHLAYMVHQFKDFVGSNTSCTLTWIGQTDLVPSSSTVYLQIFKNNTSEWETIDSDDSSDVSTDFTLTTGIGDLTPYRDADGLITARVYQEAI